MAKVTSKLQVTLPTALAIQLGIRPNRETRLGLFHQATERQRRRQREGRSTRADVDRGWSREDLYDRSRAR